MRVEYEDGDHRILEFYEQECARAKVRPLMREYLRERA